jgi:hypothetical protein
MTAASATFTLNLSTPSSNATLANTTATGTIYNNNGVTYNNASTGFGNTNTHGSSLYNAFNYSITSSRTDNLADAQIQFFLINQNQDLNSATPFRVADIGAINAGQTVSGSVDLTGAPAAVAGQQYAARLVSVTGAVTIVYDLNETLPIISEPG